MADKIIKAASIVITTNQKPQPEDPLERARHIFRKGRFETMGGPITYEQGHGAEVQEWTENGLETRMLEDQDHVYRNPVHGCDPFVRDLGIDTQE